MHRASLALLTFVFKSCLTSTQTFFLLAYWDGSLFKIYIAGSKILSASPEANSQIRRTMRLPQEGTGLCCAFMLRILQPRSFLVEPKPCNVLVQRRWFSFLLLPHVKRTNFLLFSMDTTPRPFMGDSPISYTQCLLSCLLLAITALIWSGGQQPTAVNSSGSVISQGI